jgi:hypothetical protein
MNEVRDWLKDSDPVANEPPLSEADVRRMRRAIVTAADSRQPSFSDWVRGAWAAATVVVAFVVAVSLTRRSDSVDHAPNTNVDAAPTAAVPERAARRQVQLIAPGGTRVIWIFNDDFKQ